MFQFIKDVISYTKIVLVTIGLFLLSPCSGVTQEMSPPDSIPTIEYTRDQIDSLLQAKTLIRNRASLDANTYHQAAQQLLPSYDCQDLVLADQAIEEALKQNWKNPAYNYTKGLIQEKLFSYFNARDAFRTTLRYDSTFTDAYYQLGLVLREEWLSTRGKVDPKSIYQLYNDTMEEYVRKYEGGRVPRMNRSFTAQMQNLPSSVASGTYSHIVETQLSSDWILSYERFANDLFEQSLYNFRTAAAMDSTHWQAVVQTGLLAYEVDSLALLEGIVQQIESLAGNNRDIDLFRGMALVKLRHWDEAEPVFQRAFARMTHDIRLIFQSLLYLLPVENLKNQETDAMQSLAAEMDSLRYWTARDPAYLTEANERLLEHWARCAYVHFRFSPPWSEMSGLLTDRGKIYIRFGEPLQRVRFQYFKDSIAIIMEIWYYRDRVFSFDDWWGNGRHVFAEALPMIDQYQVLRDELTIKPEEYVFDIPGELRDLPCQILYFRGEDGHTDIEIYYGVPIFFDDYITIENTPLSNFTLGYFAFDSEWQEVYSETETRIFWRQTDIDSSTMEYLPQHKTLSLLPGDYHLSFEARNETSENFSQYRDSIAVPSYQGEDLLLSDVLVSSLIQSGEFPVPDRDSLLVVPNFTMDFPTTQSLPVYCEIYNLRRSPQSGMTRYAVDIALTAWTPTRQGIGNLVAQVGNFLGFGGEPSGVTVSGEYTGLENTERFYTTLDVNSLEAGEYMLSVSVRDLVTNQIVQKEVRLAFHTEGPLTADNGR